MRIKINTPDKLEPHWLKQVPFFTGEAGDWEGGPVRAASPRVTPSSQSVNKSSLSEPVTPHTFSFNILGGKVCCQEDTYPLHLNKLSSGSGLVWPMKVVPGNRGREVGEALFLLGGCGLAATSAQGSLHHSAPLSWSDDIKPRGVRVPVFASPQLLHHPLSTSLNPASTFEHNLFIHSLSNCSECTVFFPPGS